MGGKRKASQRPKRRSTQDHTIRRIQGALSLDLLHRDYAPDDDDYVAACTGHCYVATEAAYHLFGRQAGYVSYVYKQADGTTHWWLCNEDTDDILDPTKPQLSHRFDYDQGHRRRFRTERPSKRAKELIRRVRAAMNR